MSWEDAVARHQYDDGWRPFAHDTIEACAAWLDGRRYRRAHGPSPAGAQWNAGAPWAKVHAPEWVQMDQDLRIEWELGWRHEHERLAVAALVPDHLRSGYYPDAR